MPASLYTHQQHGVQHIRPIIKTVLFSPKCIHLILMDGRNIIVPIRYFPAIKKMSLQKRKKVAICDGEVLVFEHCDEVLHIKQFLGG